MPMKQAGKWWVPVQETQQIEELTLKGGWQLERLDAALRFVQQRRTAIDGGAHIGTWALGMLERGFRSVEAYEPAEDTFECLKENVKEWKIIHDHEPVDRSIGVHKCALGPKPFYCGMKDDSKYAGGNTGGRYLKGHGEIPVRPLDCYKWREVDFIKLDVEGYEPAVIEGAIETIKANRPIIMIEEKHRMAHRFGFTPGLASKMLADLGMTHLQSIGSDHIFGWA